MRRLFLRLRAILHRAQVERDLDEELRYHLERDVERLVAQGVTPEEARVTARRSFGNLDSLKEESRDARGTQLLESLLTDVSQALRTWTKAPLFATVAVASIAIGIGANTAVFTLVDQVLLRALPVTNPRELVQVTSRGVRQRSSWGDGSELSYPMFKDLSDATGVFSGMLCRFHFPFQLSYGGRSERVAGEIVSGSYFPVLGVGAAVGRTLVPDDDVSPGAHPVAILSHAFWASRFAADPAVVGRTIVVNGHPLSIVGVARKGFDGIEMGRPTQVFVPMMMQAQMMPGWKLIEDRHYDWVKVFARLAPGTSLERAQATLQPLYRSRLEVEVQDATLVSLSAEARRQFLENRLALVPAAQGRSGFRRQVTNPLWLLMAIASGVMLTACANVANLLLVRATDRQREMAVRLALGASRRRLVQQLLVESVLLAVAAGIAGLMLALVGGPLLLSFIATPESPPPVSTLPDARILAFTFAVSLFTGILFGLAPAFQTTRTNVTPMLKDRASSLSGGRRQARLRKAFVASQVAVSLLLVIGAALFTRTLHNLLSVDAGFDTTRLLTFSVDPALNGYSRERTAHLSKTLLETLRTTPGVSAAGLASRPLLEGNQWSSGMSVEGYAPTPGEDMNQENNAISPGYFEALGIPFLRGRDFDARDERAQPAPPGQLNYRVVIVNERFAKRYFAGSDPIGRHIGFGFSRPPSIEIVGVVKDSKYTDLRSETQRQVFFPFLESPTPRLLGGFTIYLRTDRDPSAVFASAQQAVEHIDPDLPVYGLRTFEGQLEYSLRSERLVAAMSTVFGTMATLLAAIGVYGVLAQTVQRRTREIGIRMALGANASEVVGLVLREALTIAAAGVAMGLPVAWWLGRFVSSQLYGVGPTDATSLIGATVGLGAVATLAALIPSRRAARIAPTTALRWE